MVRLGETLTVGAGYLCWMLIILLWLPWSKSSTRTSLSTPMIPTLLWEVKYTITPSVVAVALGMPLVQHPVYPYDEFPPLDNIMSYITGTSIQWGSDSWITSTELTVGLSRFIWLPDPPEESTGSNPKPADPTTPVGLHHQKPISAGWVLIFLP